MTRIIGWIVVGLVLWGLLFAVVLAGDYCTEIKQYEVQGATITIYSCSSPRGGHYMMEVTCPHGGGPCRTRTY